MRERGKYLAHQHESEAPADQPDAAADQAVGGSDDMSRDLFRVALLAEANAVAVVRGEPSQNVAMTKHDEATLRRFRETAGCLNIEFVDYLIISTGDDRRWPLFHSWNADGRL